MTATEMGEAFGAALVPVVLLYLTRKLFVISQKDRNSMYYIPIRICAVICLIFFLISMKQLIDML